MVGISKLLHAIIGRGVSEEMDSILRLNRFLNAQVIGYGKNKVHTSFDNYPRARLEAQSMEFSKDIDECGVELIQ
jgi:hypothetical protein